MANSVTTQIMKVSTSVGTTSGVPVSRGKPNKKECTRNCTTDANC